MDKAPYIFLVSIYFVGKHRNLSKPICAMFLISIVFFYPFYLGTNLILIFLNSVKRKIPDCTPGKGYLKQQH